MRDVVGGIRTVVLVAVTLAALLPVAASAAVKPKPWMWTPTQAAQRLDVALDHAHWLGGQDLAALNHLRVAAPASSPSGRGGWRSRAHSRGELGI